MRPRIYTDYNGPHQPDFMLLHYFGSKADLDRLGISLSEGLEVTVYSDSDVDEDLEADGIVKYGILSGEHLPCWYVDTRGSKLRYVKRRT